MSSTAQDNHRQLIGTAIWAEGTQLVVHVDHATGTVRIAVDVGGWAPLASQEAEAAIYTREQAAHLGGQLRACVGALDESV